ncbi:MAG: thioesterase [Rhodospirillales bacterium]|nr:thioesterase [Rhodospirillales bacterium]
MTQREHASSPVIAPDTYRTTVQSDWIDYNGHMNVAYYVMVFDLAADDALATLGLDASYRQATGCSVFVSESHLVYDREIGAGASLEVHSRPLAFDDRRLLLFQEMRMGSKAAATCEVLCVHVDLASRRGRPWPDVIAAKVATSIASREADPWPARAGRSITLIRPKP